MAARLPLFTSRAGLQASSSRSVCRGASGCCAAGLKVWEEPLIVRRSRTSGAWGQPWELSRAPLLCDKSNFSFLRLCFGTWPLQRESCGRSWIPAHACPSAVSAEDTSVRVGAALGVLLAASS